MKTNGRPTGAREHVHLFVYGGRTATVERRRPEGFERVGPAEVRGMLFEVDGEPALVLAGWSRVRGEVWRCPPDAVFSMDEHHEVPAGRFRRVGVEVDGVGCWTYVAGPSLAPRLTPDRRVRAEAWTPAHEDGV